MSGQTLSFINVGDVITAALGKTIGAANRLPVELQDAALIREVESHNIDFIEEGKELMKKPFWWMKDLGSIQTYPATSLAADLATTDGSATLTSAANFPTGGGRFIVQKGDEAIDLIDYESGDGATALSTVTDIDFDHTSGDHAELLYALPANFEQMIYLWEDKKPMDPEDPNEQIWQYRPWYRIKDTYLWLPKDFGSHVMTLSYWKAPATLSTGAGNETADKAKSTDVPIKYRDYLIWRLVSHIGFVRRRDDWEAKGLAKAQATLEAATRREINETGSPYATIGPSW